MRWFVVTTLALSLAQGCVSKSKYTALEASYDEAVAARDKAQSEAEACAADLRQSRERNQKRTAKFTAVYEELLKVSDRGLAKVKIEDGRAVLQLDSDVLFPSGSATMTGEGKKAVVEIAQILGPNTDARFQVEGHTDSDAIKSREFPTNWHLGADRAINVVTTMVEAGFPADRVSAASYGSNMPVADNSTPEGKAQNRRIELVWMPEMSDVLPYKKMLKQMEKREGEAPEEGTGETGE